MKILLVQTSFLGDAILSTPVISGITKAHSGSELWLVATPLACEMLRRDPRLSGCIPFDKHGADRGLYGLLRTARLIKKHKFARAYVLHRSMRTAILLALARIPLCIGFADARLRFLYHKRISRSHLQHDVERNFAILSQTEGAPPQPEALALFPADPEELDERLRRLLASLTDYVCLVPGSVWPTKMWHWSGFRELARRLTQSGRRVVLIGSPAEREVNVRVGQDLDVVNLAGEITVAQALLFISRCSLMVCNDSMALHAASAFKVPTVAIFCATSPEFGFGPWQNRAIIVQKEGLSCKPCSRHGTRSCPAGTDACMQELTVEQVYAAVSELLCNSGPRS